MKKIYGIIMMGSLGFTSAAQEVKLGPEIGATMVNMVQRVEGTDRPTSYRLGFRVGANVDVALNPNFALQGGLNMSFNNGSESNWTRNFSTGSGIPTKENDIRNYQVTYLQMPLHAVYKTGKQFEDPHFFVGAGVYFAYGFEGTYSQQYTSALSGHNRLLRYDYNMPFGDNKITDKMWAFDMGVSAVVGYELPFGLYFKGYYTYGLLNVMPQGNSGNVLRNHGAGLSIGFYFKLNDKPYWLQ